MQWSPYVVVALAAGILLLGLAVYVYRYLDRPGARFFLVALLGSGGYSVGYAGQLVASTLQWKLLWHQLQFVPYLVIAPAMLLFAMDYAGIGRWDRRKLVVVLGIVPAVVFVSVFTYPASTVYFERVGTETVGNLVLLTFEHGPVFWLDLLYTYALFLGFVAIFVHMLVEASSLYRNQAILLILAVLVPIVASIVNWAMELTRIDVAPLFFAFTGLSITASVFHAQLMDVVPIDWSPTLDEVRAAIFVIDDRGRIVEANAEARELLDGNGDLTGATAETVVDDALDASLDDLQDGSDLERNGGNRVTHYEIRRSRITDSTGLPRGYLVSLYDVSDRTMLQQELRRQNEQMTVLNRLLRHDIRNDVGIALGRAELLEEHLDSGVVDDHLDPLLSACQHIQELTEFSRDLAETVAGDESLELTPVSVSTALQRTIDRARARYPDAVFVAPTTVPDVEVEATDMLDSLFSNLLNNAVQHNFSDEPTVEISVQELDDEVRIRIADDGPGVPDAQKEEVFGRGRKGLESSGSGLGLYLVDSIADEFGGRVWIEDNDPRGAVFVVALPVV